MNIYTFKPNLRQLGHMKDRTVEEIKNERMLWSADADFAFENGGPITEEFVKRLDHSKDWVIDTRAHMLMPGWFPCIGGWHLDDLPRDTADGQPNYKNPSYISEHVLAIIDAVDEPTGSLTEFLITEIKLPEPDPGEVVYGRWSPIITEQVRAGLASSKFVESNAIMTFDNMTFHRGQKAKTKGWRFFLRASTNTSRKAQNEFRNQVNVYIEAEAGW